MVSLKTQLRFTEPVDPRDVWARATAIIDTPAEYEWGHVPVGGNPIAWRNPLIFAEPGQGASAWVYVKYGPDGCRIVEDDEDVCPPAFVELSIVGDWTTEQEHDRLAKAFADLSPMIRDDYRGWWPL